MIVLTDFPWSYKAKSHASACCHVAGPSGATQDAKSVAPMGSSDDSSDSYNGDDAHRYLHEQNAAMDHYSEATRVNGHLEIAFECFPGCPRHC